MQLGLGVAGLSVYLPPLSPITCIQHPYHFFLQPPLLPSSSCHISSPPQPFFLNTSSTTRPYVRPSVLVVARVQDEDEEEEEPPRGDDDVAAAAATAVVADAPKPPEVRQASSYYSLHYPQCLTVLTYSTTCLNRNRKQEVCFYGNGFVEMVDGMLVFIS